MGLKLGTLDISSSIDRAYLGNDLVFDGVLASGYDSDAQAVIDYINNTDVTLTGPQEQAIDELIVGYKTDGLWSLTDALYGYVGGTANSNAVNFKDPRDLDTAFRLTFNAGISHGANGITPNGTTGFANTHFVPNTNGVYSNFGYSFYNKTDITEGSADMGAKGAAGSYLVLYSNYSGSLYNYIGTINNSVVVSVADNLGNYIMIQNGTTDHRVFRNGVQFGTIGTTDNSTSWGNLNFPLYIGGQNNQGALGEPSTRTHGCTWIGKALTPAQAALKNTRDEVFMTALGRSNFILDDSAIQLPPFVGTNVVMSPSAANETNETNSFGLNIDSLYSDNGATTTITSDPANVLNGTYAFQSISARYGHFNFRPWSDYFTEGNRYRISAMIKTPENTTKMNMNAANCFNNFTAVNGGTDSQVLMENIPGWIADEWTHVWVEGDYVSGIPLITFTGRDNTGASVTFYTDVVRVEDVTIAGS